MADFPTLSKPEDSKLFSEIQIDPILKSSIEGGYVFRRPRFTRTPRKTFITGFTRMLEADKIILQESYEAELGNIITYTHPVTLAAINVSYAEPIMFKYVGLGGVHAWNATIKLEEV